MQANRASEPSGPNLPFAVYVVIHSRGTSTILKILKIFELLVVNCAPPT